jgi:hypothetical protein
MIVGRFGLQGSACKWVPKKALCPLTKGVSADADAVIGNIPMMQLSLLGICVMQLPSVSARLLQLLNVVIISYPHMK